VLAVLLTWWIDHQHLASRNRFTIETVQVPENEPTVLRDNKTGQVLLKMGDVWQVATRPLAPQPMLAPIP
jgi:hypothetical protein